AGERAVHEAFQLGPALPNGVVPMPKLGDGERALPKPFDLRKRGEMRTDIAALPVVARPALLGNARGFEHVDADAPHERGTLVFGERALVEDVAEVRI